MDLLLTCVCQFSTSILHKLISAVPTVVRLASHRFMLKAMFLLCFNAFLRLGEICLKSGCYSDLVIQHHDLTFMYDADKVTGVSIVIKYYKKNLKQLPVKLFYLQISTMFYAVRSKHFSVIVLNLSMHKGLYFNFRMFLLFLMHLMLIN